MATMEEAKGERERGRSKDRSGRRGKEEGRARGEKTERGAEKGAAGGREQEREGVAEEEAEERRKGETARTEGRSREGALLPPSLLLPKSPPRLVPPCPCPATNPNFSLFLSCP